MNHLVTTVLVVTAVSAASCSLVTVPVKVAGGIVETTVKTTGDVAAAPFKLFSDNSDSTAEKKTIEKSGKTRALQPARTRPEKQ
jgi:hypothetical protein